MSSPTPNDPSSSIVPCDNADYTYAIYEQDNEQLFLHQTLASSNCEYLLRSEPDQVSLYSMTSGSLESIKQWDMDSNDTIWTLYSDEANNEPQRLTLSNTGCLTWNIEAANVEDPSSSILYHFCPPNNIGNTNNTDNNGFIFNSTTNNNELIPRPTTTNFFFTSTLESEPAFDPINPEENMSSDSSLDNTDIIYISVGSAFIFLVFGLLCLCTVWKNKDRESRELFNKKSNKYINSGWEEDKNRDSEADLDLHYGYEQGQEQNTKESDIAKGAYIGQSVVEYGLKVPIKYENNDTDTDDENNEIQENELGYFMNNSQESYNQYDRSVDIAHGALMDLDNNTSNRTVRINLSDISDESTSASSSDEVAEPEIVDLVQHKDKTPTKVNKGGEHGKNKWGKFNL